MKLHISSTIKYFNKWGWFFDKKNDIRVVSVIVTYNIGEEFLHYFNSIKNQVDFIIIIDNNSHEKTKKF